MVGAMTATNTNITMMTMPSTAGRLRSRRAHASRPQAAAGAAFDDGRGGGDGGHQEYRIRGFRNAYRTSTIRFTMRKMIAKIRIMFWTTT